MTLWDNLCCYGYGIQARWEALGHLLRGHKLKWRGDCIDLWTGHLGYIECKECPDTALEDGKHVGLDLWMRHNRLIWWFARRLCAWLGHPEHRHPQHMDTDLGMSVDIESKWYCCRCLADTKGPGHE